MSEFDYELPAERIAQRPIEPRDRALLLVDAGPGLAPEHRTVADLADLVGQGDVVVMNDTRVLAARLLLHKRTGGAVEVLLLEPAGDGTWSALVKPSRRVPDGTELRDGDDRCVVVVVGGHGESERRVTVAVDGVPVVDVDGALVLDAVGRAPLPPYITEPLDDPGRYQTVVADRPGSVAAPTAGLHLTDALIAAMEQRGAVVRTIELVVGLDTFRPVTAERTDEHVMHSERYRVDPETLERCRGADRVVAIGTTTVRALESAALRGPEGRTDLFITRGHRWQLVDVLLTNFHLPRSTLLVMIDAFVGPRWRDLYGEALARGYRFLSFGDAMLLQRSAPC